MWFKHKKILHWDSAEFNVCEMRVCLSVCLSVCLLKQNRIQILSMNDPDFVKTRRCLDGQRWSCSSGPVADRCKPSEWWRSCCAFRSYGVQVPAVRHGIARCSLSWFCSVFGNGSRGVKHTDHMRLASSYSTCTALALTPVTECGLTECQKILYF